MTTTNAQYWRDALQLESAALVKRLYKKIHGRELNTTRALQVVSAYLQGKEYYRNAVQADISVQPLLLFYGVSSLSRALTLLLKQCGGEETLKQGHGLTCAGWNGVLSTNVGGSLKHLGALEVQSSAGMFTDLLNATENSSYLHVRSGKVDWSIRYSITLPINIVFSDLVQRIPDVRAEYTLWAEKPQLALLVNNITVLGDQFDIKTRKRDNIGDVLQYAQGRITVAEEGDFFVLKGDKRDLPLFTNSFVERMFGSIPNLYIAPPLPQEVYISQIPLTFILSYCLGMLCRYYPSHWVALSRGNIRDEAWPLMQACISYMEEAFPQLVMEAIQQKAEEGKAA